MSAAIATCQNPETAWPQALGVPEVQIHEPILTLSGAADLKADFAAAFAAFAEVGVPINLVVPYDDIGDAYPWVVQLPVQVGALPN